MLLKIDNSCLRGINPSGVVHNESKIVYYVTKPYNFDPDAKNVRGHSEAEPEDVFTIVVNMRRFSSVSYILFYIQAGKIVRFRLKNKQNKISSLIHFCN